MKTNLTLKKLGKLSILVGAVIFAAQNSNAFCFGRCSSKQEEVREAIVSSLLESNLQCYWEGYYSYNETKAKAYEILVGTYRQKSKMTISESGRVIVFSEIYDSWPIGKDEELIKITLDNSLTTVTKFVHTHNILSEAKKQTGPISDPRFEKSVERSMLTQVSCQ